jgi:GTP-binding protein
MSHLVAIVGRPNVGKSTLFNRLIGEKKAILSEIPGTTRDVLFGTVEWQRHIFTVADTAGIELDDKSQIGEDVLVQTKLAVESADVILFLVNGREGLNAEDTKAAELIRKLDKPVILMINKTDRRGKDEDLTEFYKLGFKQVHLTSGLTGKGTGDVLDEVVDALDKLPPSKLAETDDGKEIIRVAILGRPNVGKSTLFNTLLGKKRSVVSDEAGTTRDTVNERIDFGEHIIEFVDTAGLRRRGKIEKGIEQFSSLRVLKSIQDADICLLVTEANEGVIAQDLHILQMIIESHKGALLVVNKWDLVEKHYKITAEFDQFLDARYIFAKWMPRLYISGLTGQRANKILQQVVDIFTTRGFKIPTKDLNRLVAKAVTEKPPVAKRMPPKFYFSHQIDIEPPTIEFKVNRPDHVHVSYERYLENKIREVWPFEGTPIKIVLKKSSTRDK